MTPERWQQVEEVLQAALDRPPHERASFLNEACSEDEALRQEASSLIEAYDEAGNFIEEPAIAHDAHILISSHQRSNIESVFSQVTQAVSWVWPKSSGRCGQGIRWNI